MLIPSSDNWRVEYEQLSRDVRFYQQMGWQAPVAVLAADGLIVGAVLSSCQNYRSLGLLPSMAAVLTFLMAFEAMRWIKRVEYRVPRLQIYDRTMRFGRFYCREGALLELPLGEGLVALMILVGMGLVVFALILFLGIPPI